MESYGSFEHLKIEEICRVCLEKKEHMRSITEAGLSDMLLECASIQVLVSLSFLHVLQSNSD